MKYNLHYFSKIICELTTIDVCNYDRESAWATLIGLLVSAMYLYFVLFSLIELQLFPFEMAILSYCAIKRVSLIARTRLQFPTIYSDRVEVMRNIHIMRRFSDMITKNFSVIITAQLSMGLLGFLQFYSSFFTYGDKLKVSQYLEACASIIVVLLTLILFSLVHQEVRLYAFCM